MKRSVMIDDIELRISKWKPSDDSELERDYISHLIDLVGNSVIAAVLKDDFILGGSINSNFVKRFVYSDFTEDDAPSPDDQKRIYFDIDFDIIQLPDDMGIVRCTTNGGQEIVDTPNTNLDNIKYFRLGNPSKENLIRTREGRRIWIWGASNAFTNRGSVFLWAVPVTSFYSDDDELPFGTDLADTILDMVEQKLLRALEIESDLDNDGEDSAEIDPTSQRNRRYGARQ